MRRLALLPLLLVCAASAQAPADDVEVENLEAAARLYGLVRWFHPSDEAAAVDWDRMALLATSRALEAPTPEALADSLRSVFGPVAPTLRIAVGAAPEAPDVPDGDRTVTWQHLGVTLAPGPSVYESVRLGRSAPAERSGFGVVARAVEVKGLRGRRVRLSAAVRTEAGAGQLWLRVDRPDDVTGFFDNMDDRPVRASTWARYAIEGPVADDAVAVMFGGLVPGRGDVVFDGFRLEAQAADGTWEEVPLENGSFEGGAQGWYAGAPGYAAEPVDGAAEGDRALRLASTDDEPGAPADALFEARATLGDAAVREIGRGLVVRVPLALPSRAGRTLPAAEGLDGLRDALAAVAPGPRAARAADVAVAWSVFEHFFPYFDVVEADWDAALGEALRDALGSDDSCAPLKRLVARLRDGHGRVGCTGSPPPAFPAFAVERVEGLPVVVATADTTRFRVGDVVRSLDGRDAAAVLDSLEALASGSPQWRARRAARAFGEGEAGTTARVGLDRDGRRVAVEAPRDQPVPPAESRPPPVGALAPGVEYVDLERVTEEGLNGRLEALAAAEGVVFDLRGYPRIPPAFLAHLAERPVQSALWETPQTVRPDRAGPAAFDTSRWAPMPPAEPHVGGRVVVLVDERAISYAESVLGIVDHYGLATTVGGPTAGANGNVNPFAVPGGHRISWTGMRVRRHDGRTLFGVGIEPDVPVTRTLAGVRAGRDEVLERGLKIARGGR